MKRGEKVVLLIAVASIIALAAKTILTQEKRKYKRWGVCGSDVKQLCSEPPGGGPLTTRILKCLGTNYPKLTPPCQQLMDKDYAALVKKPKPKTEIAPDKFSVGNFLAPCRAYWSAECGQLSDTTGADVRCYAFQSNYKEFSKQCRSVMVEVVQWNPKECTEAPAFDRCKAIWGLKRLECYLRNRNAAPPSCGNWLQTVEKVAEQ